MVLPVCPLPPTSSHFSQGGCFAYEESAVENTQQLITWNLNRWSRVTCAGGTEVWQLRERLRVSLDTACTTQTPYLSGYPGSGHWSLLPMWQHLAGCALPINRFG